MTDRIKTGLIGAGAFGANHAAKLASLPISDFQGLYDADPARAAAIAEKHGAAVFPSLEALLGACQAVIVATPARTHAPIAAAAIGMGRHVLVEKPLTATRAGAEALAAAAAQAGVRAQAGHQERFVLEALGLFAAPEKPLEIHSVREGPFTGRNMDVSVTLDLMIHDLDLTALLFGDAPSTIAARGRKEKGPEWDEVEADLRFADGRATLRASRIADERRRAMRVIYPSGVVEVDFLTRAIRSTAPFSLDPDFATKTPDPLGQGVAAFLEAVRSGSATAIPAESGAAAVALAEAIDLACV